MLIEYDVGTVVKRPETTEDKARLEREATLLVEARHAGVVALLDSGRDERGLWLRLEDAGGVTIETILAAGGGDDVVLPLLATVATTVADLHDIGVVHGAIEASHVLVDRDGRAVLCSFGRGGHVGDVDTQIDVAALARLIETALAGDLSVDLVDLVDLVDAACDPQAGRHRVSAQDLADALRGAHRGGRVWPGNSTRVLRPRDASYRARGPRLSRPRGAVVAALVAGGVLAAIAAFMFMSGSRQHSGRLPRTGPAAARQPLTGAPFTYREGILSFSGQRFAVGEPGDQVAIGRWSCADPQVALLRPSGSIYVFDHLATAGLDQEGRLIANAPGATWLRAQAGAKSGCDLMMVGNAKGSALVRPAAP